MGKEMGQSAATVGLLAICLAVVVPVCVVGGVVVGAGVCAGCCLHGYQALAGRNTQLAQLAQLTPPWGERNLICSDCLNCRIWDTRHGKEVCRCGAASEKEMEGVVIESF
jgi:hypothetical protein